MTAPAPTHAPGPAPGQPQISPAEFARRIAVLAGSPLVLDRKRALARELLAETLGSLGYADGLAILERMERGS